MEHITNSLRVGRVFWKEIDFLNAVTKVNSKGFLSIFAHKEIKNEWFEICCCNVEMLKQHQIWGHCLGLRGFHKPWVWKRDPQPLPECAGLGENQSSTTWAEPMAVGIHIFNGKRNTFGSGAIQGQFLQRSQDFFPAAYVTCSTRTRTRVNVLYLYI